MSKAGRGRAIAAMFNDRKKALGFAALAVAVLALGSDTPRPATAAMAVVDTLAISRLTAQINELRRQFDELVDINAGLQAQIDAIGAAGRVSLPSLNLDRLGVQFRNARACLTPDWRRLLPSFDFDDVDLSSICQRGRFYRRALFATPEGLKAAGTGAERTALRRATNARRRSVLVDAVTKSLAHGDQNQQDADRLSAAADELDAAVSGATTMNERLAAIGQGQALTARALVAVVQIMAQMQRADAAFYLATATTIEDAPPDTSGGGTP